MDSGGSEWVQTEESLAKDSKGFMGPSCPQGDTTFRREADDGQASPLTPHPNPNTQEHTEQ